MPETIRDEDQEPVTPEMIQQARIENAYWDWNRAAMGYGPLDRHTTAAWKVYMAERGIAG